VKKTSTTMKYYSIS